MYPNAPDNPEKHADDELLASLQTALRPEPLPDALVDRIQQDWDRRGRSARTIKLPRSLWLGLAAAAGLTLALLIPTAQTTNPPAVASVALSDADATAIVQALAVMEWDGAVEYTISLADASLDVLQETITADASRDEEFFLFAADDWDAPPS